jgi:hypothetical protein
MMPRERFSSEECCDIAAIYRRDIPRRFQRKGLVNERLRHVFRSHFASEEVAGHIVLFRQSA